MDHVIFDRVIAGKGDAASHGRARASGTDDRQFFTCGLA
jgi:hypothetical protein